MWGNNSICSTNGELVSDEDLSDKIGVSVVDKRNLNGFEKYSIEE